jgi:hypothetical protein
MTAYSIAGINRLPLEEKRQIYFRFVPNELCSMFGIRPDMTDASGRSLARLEASPGSADVVLEIKHAVDARDPTLYVHLTDTVNGQIHVLLYITNDPHSPRFDVDRMPDGTPTEFGTQRRNLEAEEAALKAGLTPGQIHRGLRILRESVDAFERFVASIGHDVYFVDPLYYHNAIIFESYGFAYQRGLRKMEDIHRGFAQGGPHRRSLDGASPFRAPDAADSIRGRSWAIHDGILGFPFSGVTMYRTLGRDAQIKTFPNATW